MTVFICGIALLGLFAWRDLRRQRTPEALSESFFVNGRSSGVSRTAFSITASCVGGSATLGMAGMAWELGLPAFWWLGSGACGLFLLGLLLARKVRASGAFTLPEMASRLLGPRIRPLLALIILVAWTAILAAQFKAMGHLIVTLTGADAQLALFAGAGLLVLNVLLGGQAAVIRSDQVQCALILGGLGLVLLWLLYDQPLPVAQFLAERAATTPLEWTNEAFPPERVGHVLLVIGGSYVVCPMLFGRLFSARDSRCAVRGCTLAVFCLVLAALLIVALGLLCRDIVAPGTPPDQVLLVLLRDLPPWLGNVLLLTLCAAILSSADSCLITAATVGGNDLLRRPEARICRRLVLLIGGAAALGALWGQSLMGLLLMANDVYVCGVVGPVFVGLLLLRPKLAGPVVAEPFGLVAVALGGLCGLASALGAGTGFMYAGLALSLGCALLGALWGRWTSTPAGLEAVGPVGTGLAATTPDPVAGE